MRNFAEFWRKTEKKGKRKTMFEETNREINNAHRSIRKR